MSDKLSPALQENLLVLLTFSNKASVVIRNSVPVNLYGNKIYREIADKVYNYLDEFKTAPGDHLPDLLEEELSESHPDAVTFRDVLIGVGDLRNTVHEDYILGQLEKFVRQQTLKTSVVEASDAIQAGQLDEAEAALTRGLQTRLTVFSPGLGLMKGLELAFNNEVRQDVIPTGIKQLDQYHLGPGKGEFHLYIGAPKAGKCIGEDELVLLPNGQRKRIADVVKDKDPHVLAFDEATGKLRKAKIANHWDNGKKRCIRITTRSGRSITVTPEHPFFTPNGWQPAGELDESDFVAVPISIPGLGSAVYEKHKLRLLGYFIADGNLTSTTVAFTKYPPEKAIREDFEKCIHLMGDVITWNKENTSCSVISTSKTHRSNHTREWLKEVGLFGKPAKEKTIPDFIFQLTDECIVEFLMAYFSCDSDIGKKEFGYSAANYRLVSDINHLLIRLGIFSRIKHTTPTFKGKRLPGYGEAFIHGRKNLLKFLALFTNFTGGKKKRIGALRSNLALMADDRNHHNTKHLSDDVLFDKVASVTNAGMIHTYDLTVDDYHTFVAEDMVAHNTWWLVHMAKRGIIHRKKVVYLTLELSEAQITQRMIQSLFSMSRKKAQIHVSRLITDELGRLIRLEHDQMKDRMSFDMQDARRAVERKLSRMHAIDNFIVKQYPAGMLTVRGVYGYLSMLEQSTGFVPDMLVIDYPDYMKIDAKNYRLESAALYNDLRGLAVEKNIAVVVASRSNREGAKSKLITGTHSGEDFSRVYTADTVLTYTQTSQERDLGVARLFVDSSRVAEKDKFVVLLSQSYHVGQYCLDSAAMNDNYWSHVETATANLPQRAPDSDND